MKKYIKRESIYNSIDYFCNNEQFSKQPQLLGMFFFFKSLNISKSEYLSFPRGRGNEEFKNICLKKLYHLGGIFSPQENGKSRACVLPFSIKDNMVQKRDFYNGATEFSRLYSRLHDTIDNSLTDNLLNKEGEEDNRKIKLMRNYLSYIKENYLEKNKISIVNFSIWVCRFTEFEVDDNISDDEFTRICVKYIIKYFNITDLEFDEIFYDDSNINLIKYDNSMITGDELRSKITFENYPDIESTPSNSEINQCVIVSLNETRGYIEMNGNNPSFEEIKKLLMLRKQIILYGVPGIGKSRFISCVEDYFKDTTTKVQFHPSTTYEEFIGGTTIENASVTTKAGKFLEKCIEAKNNPGKDYLFVIDEINRGNISKIFGETILALDREYEVDLIKPIKLGNNDVIKFKIPKNMYIIATMNSADRSIAVIDYAIRRRFGFIKLQPNYEVVKEMSNIESIGINIEKLFKVINGKIQEVLGEEELLLGQSYFLPDFAEKIDGKIKWTSETLRMVFNYSIVPIIEEYTYGNKNDLISILGEKISSRINDNDEFLDEIKRIFPEVN